MKALSLVPREQRFYDLFEQQASILVSAGVLLEQTLEGAGDLSARRREIKDLERQGDKVTYEIVRSLNETFVTPFDHEDISALAAGLDDILDYIEEIADTVNLYGITTVPRPANELADLLAQAVTQLEHAVGKLRSGEKDGEYAIEVHRLEDIGDSTSRHAIAELFQGQRDPLEVIKLKDLYALLEDALDRCEDVANVIENIAIKNA
jgi:predicted phosphate transport protein (TIGR00153 family)